MHLLGIPINFFERSHRLCRALISSCGKGELSQSYLMKASVFSLIMEKPQHHLILLWILCSTSFLQVFGQNSVSVPEVIPEVEGSDFPGNYLLMQNGSLNFETENLSDSAGNGTGRNEELFQIYQEQMDDAELLKASNGSLEDALQPDEVDIPAPPLNVEMNISTENKTSRQPPLKLCKSRTCRKRSKYLSDPMDFDNFTPCGHFSQFVCGKEWKDHLPTYFKSWGFVERVSFCIKNKRTCLFIF